MRPSAFLRGVLLAPLLLPACGKGPSGSGAPRRELVFYCGAGLRDPAEKLISFFESRFPVRIRTDYAGSEVLLSRLKLHREGDLFMPGDARYVDQARKAGFVADRKSLHKWRLVIFVPKGNPAGVKDLEDLATEKVRLGLGDPRACAVGKAARRLFEKNGIPWEKVKKGVDFLSLTVNELALQVQAGSLDAVIVWDATARQFARWGETIAIPPEKNLVSTVDLAVLSFSKFPGLARKLLRAAASPEGKAAFEGF